MYVVVLGLLFRTYGLADLWYGYLSVSVLHVCECVCMHGHDVLGTV